MTKKEEIQPVGLHLMIKPIFEPKISANNLVLTLKDRFSMYGEVVAVSKEAQRRLSQKDRKPLEAGDIVMYIPHSMAKIDDVHFINYTQICFAL